MAPGRISEEPLQDDSHKCDQPFLTANGSVAFFDVASANPGTFTVPGVIELEVYEPGSFVEFLWIFFKGDPRTGPRPGHPFEMPFNNTVEWSIDLVRANDTSSVVQQLMPPTNSTPFWKGGAPFGRHDGNYSLIIPMWDESCRYNRIAEMIYRWTVPEDFERDTDFRLMLATDIPLTTHISGKLRISGDSNSSPSLWTSREWSSNARGTRCLTILSLMGLVLLLLCGVFLRVRRLGQRIVLE